MMEFNELNNGRKMHETICFDLGLHCRRHCQCIVLFIIDARSHNLNAVNTSETEHEQFYGIQREEKRKI